MNNLLPADALKGVRVGISASRTADLARLGLLEDHFRLALAEIARLVLVSGGSLAYGGHLDPSGYTTFLVQELRRYAEADRGMLVVLAWPVHRAMPLSALNVARSGTAPIAEIVYLDPEGREIDPAEGRGEAGDDDLDPALVRSSLTAMRRYLSGRIDGRVLLGGQREGFLGEIPGLMEEALLALELRQPLYVAGGFGGVTLDIARALGVDEGNWLPPRPEAPRDDPRLTDGFERLRAIATGPGWEGLRNGLTEDENRALAASHRPSEIASLVGLGLGRLRQARGEG